MTDPINSGLRASVESRIPYKVSPSKLQPLLDSLTLYVFRGCHQADIRKVLAKLDFNFDFLSWRRDLPHNGVLLKDCKLWLYRLYLCNEKITIDSLSRKDRNSLEASLDNKLVSRHLRSLKQYGAPALLPEELDSRIADSLYSHDVTAFLHHVVRTKLAFLVQSFGYSARDLVDELRLSSLVALLKTYPRYEHLGHMRAVCKANAANRAQNIIDTNTTDSRQRLRQNPDGTYTNLLVPMDLYGSEQSIIGEDGTVSATLVSGLDGVSHSQWERLFSLRQLTGSASLTPKQRLFLRLALGEPHGDFSAFIGRSNDEAIEAMSYNDYIRKVCRFVKVTEEMAHEFLQSLQPRL